MWENNIKFWKNLATFSRRNIVFGNEFVCRIRIPTAKIDSVLVEVSIEKGVPGFTDWLIGKNSASLFTAPHIGQIDPVAKLYPQRQQVLPSSFLTNGIIKPDSVALWWKILVVSYECNDVNFTLCEGG